MYIDLSSTKATVVAIVVGIVLCLLLFLKMGLTVVDLSISEDEKKFDYAGAIASAEDGAEFYEGEISKLEESLAENQKVRERRVALNLKETELSKLGQDTDSYTRAIAKIEKEIEAINSDFSDYRQRYREYVRGLAVGESIDLSKSLGDEYKDLKIRKVDAEFVHVMLTSGPKGIPYTDLPTELQERFQFSEDEAEEFRSQRDANRAKAGAAMAAYNEKVAEKKAAQREQDKEREIRGIRAQIDQQLNLEKGYLQQAENAKRAADAYHYQYREARRLGKITMAAGQAKSEEAKAANFIKRATQARRNAGDLQRKLMQMIPSGK